MSARIGQRDREATQAEDDRDRLTAEVLSLRAERDAWRDALFASNDLLRSAYSVAQREGKNTNWGPLQSRLYDGLQTQHRLMYPPTEAQP